MNRLNEPGDYSPSAAFSAGDKWTTHHREKSWAIWRECKSEFGKNRLVFSRRFVSAFRELEESLTRIEIDEAVPLEEVAREAKCLREAHSQLLTIALAELDLDPAHTTDR